MRDRSINHRWLAVAVYVCCWAYLAFPWLSGQVTIPYDAKALFQAQLQFLATALHSGQSPFWNPYTFAGFPQIADPQSLIFSPALLIAYFVERPGFGLLDVYVMVLLGAGGLAILFLFFDRNWHPAAAVFAGIVYSFGGSAAWRIQHIGHIQAYAFFAIALWLLLRALKLRSPFWGACAGLAGGLMLVEPNQMGLLGAYALAIVYVGHLLSAGSISDEICATRYVAGAAAVAAIAFAAVPVALTHLFLQQSNRPVIDIAEAARGSLHPASLLTFAIADLFGALDPRVDYWGPYSEHWDKNELTLSQNMSQIYFGVLPAVLILQFGIIRRHVFDPSVRIFGVLAAASILYALGSYTPLYNFLHAFAPGIGAFRRPVDATFLAGAMVAIVSGYLLHLWLTGQIRAASRARFIAEMLVITAILLAGGLVAGWAGKFEFALKPMLTTCAWLAGGLLILHRGGGRMRQQTAAAMVALALFLSLDISIHNAANASTGVRPTEIADVLKPQTRNETIAFLKTQLRNGTGTAWRDRVELIGLGFDWQNCGEVHRLENTLGYNPFRIGLVSQALGAKDYNVGPDQRSFSPLFPSYNSVLADMIGLRFVASSAPVDQIDTALRPRDLVLVARTKDAYIYENPGVLPRAFLVGAAQPADFDAILRTGRWPDFDPRTTVLLQERETGMLQQLQRPKGAAGFGLRPESSTILRYDNDRIDVRTTSEAAAALVLADIWHPWWFASIDGVETRLVRANSIFRAVLVPSGTHVVTFRFRPFYGAFQDVIRRLSRS